MTSPPFYGLRSYTDGGEHYVGQIGDEKTPQEYLAKLWECTQEWVRALKPGGSIFVELGDSYYSGKGAPGRMTIDPKNAGRNARRTTRSPLDYGLDLPRKTLLGLPWRYALGCVDQLGLILRAEIVWDHVNGLPESVTDRVRRGHSTVFHFTRQPRYFSAVDEIREPHAPVSLARSRRAYNAGDLFSVGTPNTLDPAQFCNPLGKLPGSVWEIPSAPLVVPPHLGVDHFAAYPPELVRRIVLGWSPPGVCTACGEGRHPNRGRPCERCGEFIPTQAKRCAECGYVRDWKAGRVAVAAMGATDWSTPGHGTPRHPGGHVNRSISDGYACACPEPDAPTRPAVVVDPFGGTGTTALVASVLGRIGVTVDRSGDYCRLAAWRTRDPGERARALGVPKPPPVPDGQGSLFDEMEAS